MNYFVDFKSNENGDHEIHAENCSRINSFKHLTYLGEFKETRSAISKASEIYGLVKLCPHCRGNHGKD